MWLNEKALPERCLKFRRVSRQLHRMLCRILYEKEVQGVRAPKKLLFYIDWKMKPVITSSHFAVTIMVTNIRATNSKS